MISTMKGFYGFLLSVCLVLVAHRDKTVVDADGSLCEDLTGTWKNKLNSNMTIESVTNKSFTGVYHTAVESVRGAARLSSKISGMIQSTEHGKLIAFNVLWNKGASLTAWVGQCAVCDGKARIYTTWVLRSYLPSKKRWMTTRINQDTFERLESTTNDDGVHEVTTTLVSENTVSESEMQGTWTSSTGDSLEIKEFQGLGSWTGEHHVSNLHHGHVNVAVGRYDGNQTYTAVGFVAAGTDRIRGWTGHIDNFEETKVLETSWLEHSFQHDCSNPRKHVQFGMENYSKA